MKVLMQTKGGLGKFFVNFTPIHNDWLLWKTVYGDLKIIHEKCYHVIATNHKGSLDFLSEATGICSRCGVEAPTTVRNFILLANGLRKYEDTKRE